MGDSLSKIGDVRRAEGDRPRALAAHEESLAIIRKLATIDPRNADWQHDMSVALGKIGEIRTRRG